MRKETPDSEAIASSEDERPWPTAPSFGTLPRKENGMPGISGGIWSTQKRGSFKLEKTPQRPVARDSRLGAINPPRSGLRPDGTPSPSASDGSGALPFAIPLQPTPKAGRSLSHSQGQREGAQPPGSGSRSTEQNMVLSLGYLAEEVDDTETDSELGGGLTHTTSHPPIGTLQRMSTLPPSFDSFYGMGHSKDSLTASGHAHAGARADKKLEAAFANLALDPSQRRAQWQTHLGWDDVPNVNESRRHSLADIPTRRGSLVGVEGRSPQVGGPFWSSGLMYNWEEETHSSDHSHRDSLSYGNTSHELNKSNDASSRSETHSLLAYNDHTDGRTIDIPTMYKAPNISIADHERSDQDKRGQASISSHWTGGGGGPHGARPRKLLYMITFKCSRVETFYLLENTGLSIREGDIVIVEADRGQDLGTVQHANVTPDEARVYKRKYGEEQYKWLMMFSKNNAHSNVNPNAQLFGENSSGGGRNTLITNAPATMQGSPRGDMIGNLKPKAIKRLANAHEIRMLSEKEGNEAKAKRACQQKVAHLHLDMEILDAEWQWDFQKLIFYYYADHYINFKDLITELYRIYKTRIWMSAINPASFSQHAAGQPPSGIGPGAVGGFNPVANSSYTMMYGADPDPYGAIPPYRIGYDTYTPNYPGIPGVANSFAPPAAQPAPMPAAPGFPHYGSASGDVTPSGVQPQGASGDLQYYNASQEQTPRAYPTANPFAGTAAAPADYYPQPLFLPPGFTAPPSTSAERGAYGYGYNAYGNTSPAAAASGTPPIGRQATIPAPIGTRAPSMGSSAFAPPAFGTPPTSNPPGQRPGGLDQRFRAWPPLHTAAEFVPGHQQTPFAASRAQASRSFFGGVARPGTAGQAGAASGLGGAQTGVKEERVKAFIDGLGRKEGEGPPPSGGDR